MVKNRNRRKCLHAAFAESDPVRTIGPPVGPPAVPPAKEAIVFRELHVTHNDTQVGPAPTLPEVQSVFFVCFCPPRRFRGDFVSWIEAHLQLRGVHAMVLHVPMGCDSRSIENFDLNFWIQKIRDGKICGLMCSPRSNTWGR